MLMMFGIVVLRLAVALSKAGSSEAAAHTTTFALPSKTRRGKLHWGSTILVLVVWSIIVRKKAFSQVFFVTLMVKSSRWDISWGILQTWLLFKSDLQLGIQFCYLHIFNCCIKSASLTCKMPTKFNHKRTIVSK